MKQCLSLLFLILIFSGCSNNHENDFIKEHPESKKYIDFLKSHKEKLLEIDHRGFKLEWRLHVYCEDFEKHGGFRGKFYAFKDKYRTDILFADGKKWIRIFDGKRIHDFVDGHKNNEFIERWGKEPVKHPYIEPLLGENIEYSDFEAEKTDSNHIAYLRLISGDEKVTFLFTNEDYEEYTVLFHEKDFNSYEKISYGINYRFNKKIRIPEISVSEIPTSGWCNGGKRFVDKDEYNVDFDWEPDENTFKIKETMSFIENIDSVIFESKQD